MKWLDGRRGFGMLCSIRFSQTALSELKGQMLVWLPLCFAATLLLIVCRPVFRTLSASGHGPCFDIIQAQSPGAENENMI